MSNVNSKGLAAERFQRIRDMLKKNGVMRVNKLSHGMRVSPATIRRDLLQLDRQGLVRRVHGGAVCVETLLDEPLFDDKAAISEKEKQKIAEKSLSLIKPNETIFLDGGSTVSALARLLTDMHNLTVVTNSLRVAGVFSGNGPKMILVGGEFRRLSQTIVGPLTHSLLDQLNVDTAFMGTIGISADDGMTTTDSREAYTKSMVMSHARQVVLLADSSKIGKVSFVKFGSSDNVDILITDSGADKNELNKIRKKGITVIICR